MAKKSKSESYWEQRSIEMEAAWQKKCRETVEKELAAYYRQALHHIQQDIEALYGTYAKDNAVTMPEARKILQGNEYRVWRMDMQEYINEIRRISETEGMTKSSQLLKELNTLAMRSRITRLDKLYSETLLELGRLAGKTGKSMDKFLSEAYKDGYYHNLYEIGKKAWLKSTPAKVDSSQVMNVLRTPWSGKNYSQRIWNNNAKLGKTIKETIEQGIHRGSSVAKLSKQVAERMDVGTRDASRLVRTELNFVQNRAALESIKDAGMEFFRFVATLDSRTSQQCRSHDGHVYPIDEASPGENMPPLHARCRSTICASLGAEDSHGGRRIARNEDGKKFRVPEEMRYGDWKAVYIDKNKTWGEWADEAGYKGREIFANSVSSSSQTGGRDDIIKMKGGVNHVVAAIHNELAVVRDNGIKGAYRVDFELVNSKTYHDKFEGLTGHKAVDEALYRRAALMLEHRSGTPYEDIAMLDSRTGKVLVENTSAYGDMKFMSGLTSSQAETLNAMGRLFEILHNHPNSSVPSSADIRWLFKRHQAVATTIIGHDGSVYRIKKLKAYDDFDFFMDALYDAIKITHPEWSKNKLESYLFEQLIEIGERQGFLHYVKR